MAIEAQDIHDLAKAIGDALGPKKEWVEIAKAAFWPAVVAFAVAIFRRPFSRMLEGLGNRVAKLSIFDVSIELVSVTTRPLSFYDINIPTDNLEHGGFTPTDIMTLVNHIRTVGLPYFLVVDIGDGRRWLISRLLLFTFVLWRIERENQPRLRGLRRKMFWDYWDRRQD